MSNFSMFVTSELSCFEISLMHVPCNASQHNHDVFFVARVFQIQAVLSYVDGTCT
jgi:hypothetical protein